MKRFCLLIMGLLILGMSFSQTTVKKVTVIIILLLFSTIINSQTLDNERVKSISQIWASTHNLNSEIANIICKTLDDEPLLYIINFKKGWVMISADESLKPVLGFSFDANYSEENEPDAIKSLFEFYSLVKNENRTNNIKFTAEWELIESGNLRTANDTEEVEPLISVLWAQDWPYNAYCPLDDDMPENYNGHHNTSCGPTAFAQILRYWAYPVQGIGYHSYTYEDLGFVEADFGSTYYNWDNMSVSLDFDDLEPVYTDVATLMLHAGVSVDGAWQSGGGLSQYSSAAVKYFDYSPSCEVLYRDDFTNTEWHNIFRDDLDNGRPIMMSGCSEGSVTPWEYGVHYGHYFVCDGYYGDDFYHINWGWGGGSNGYFPLFALGNYIYYNDALIGLEPNYENKELLINDPYTVDENTVVLLHFDGDLTNQSTLTNDPTAHGTTVFTDNSAMGLGQCLYLDNSSQGNQSFLDIADNNNLDLSNDWTIEMWFKPTSFGNNWYKKFTLLNKPGDNDNFESNYSVYMLPTADWNAKSLYCSYFFTEQVDKNPAYIHTDRNFLELEEWYHFTFIRNTTDKTLKLVIHNSDGELIHYASSPYYNEVASQPLLNANPLLIGSSNESNTYFDGYIDEFRISNVVREFEITSTELTLLVPDGGECWQSGTTQQISWSCVNIENLKLEYSTNNGEFWELISNSVDASLGQYDWLIPNVISQQCLIKITDTSNDNTYKISNSPFYIYDQLTLNLISPNGGEFFIASDLTQITWENTPVANIKIEFSDDNGSIWNELTANFPVSAGSFDWTVPDVTSNQCIIKITDITDANVFNISDSTFEIGPPNNAGGPYVVDNNTILLLHFDNDLSVIGSYSGEIANNGEGESYETSQQKFNKCFRINNSSSVQCVTMDVTQEVDLGNNWTVDFWAKVGSYGSGASSYPSIFIKDGFGMTAIMIKFRHEGGGFSADLTFADNTESSIVQYNGIDAGKWYHVALVSNAEKRTISLIVHDKDWNSVFNESIAFPAGSDGTLCTAERQMFLGGVTGGSNIQFDGWIDEFRISNTARSFVPSGFSEFNTSGLISIYPNPSKTSVFISSPKVVNLSIYSLTGQKIWEEKNFLKGAVDVSGFYKGIYLIVFTDEKITVSRKLIIE